MEIYNNNNAIAQPEPSQSKYDPRSILKNVGVAATGLAALVMASTLPGTASAQDMLIASAVPNGAPSTEGATLIGQERADVFPSLPGEETIARTYQREDGTYFKMLSVANRSGDEVIYGMLNDTNGAAPWETFYFDTDGDGIFDLQEVYSGQLISTNNDWIRNFQQS